RFEIDGEGSAPGDPDILVFSTQDGEIYYNLDAGTTEIQTNTWYYAAVTIDWAGDDAYLYLDAQVEDSAVNTWTQGINYETSPLIMGSRKGVDQWFDGEIDEVRISTDDRTAQWISTGHNNQDSPSTFYNVGSQETLPSVDITVSVYHTNASGGDPLAVAISSVISIDTSTSNPYTLSIGSGGEQTFSSVDPRRLRVNIDVTAVNSSGSFTLAYDSAAAPSSMDTPSITIPGVTVLLLVVVVLIPLLTSLMTRKRRLTVWLLTIILSLIVSLTLLAQQVFPVSAAPDTFYLRDTTINVASPAGQDMNLIQGSSEDTILLDATNYLAYWYTDITYPTGDDDASIAAGNYTLNMHFDQLPGSSTWWDASYGYRKELTITAGASDVPSGYSVSLTFDHEFLVDIGRSQSDGDDIAITYWNGSGWVELDRILDPGSSWNTDTTTIWFQTQAAISATSSDSDYDLYYGNPS
ncbi:MAG: hypothetical protein KAT23_00005, partial [Anaerolineales bacterium]|nr:hypothetical protein [Anaerolineales bacterium]